MSQGAIPTYLAYGTLSYFRGPIAVHRPAAGGSGSLGVKSFRALSPASIGVIPYVSDLI